MSINRREIQKTFDRGQSGSAPRYGVRSDLLPQSVGAINPTDSFSTTTESLPGSRRSSMALRQRSGMSVTQNSLTNDMSNGMQRGYGHAGDANRAKPSPKQYYMPDQRICFPNWSGYLVTLFFIAFWAGFLAIGITSFNKGRLSRLTHPTDMFGFTCGEMNYWNDIQVNLTDREMLYWLDPFELTNVRNKWFAKGICVSSCPTSEDVCQMENVPCMDTNSYRCPYYALAQDGLYGTLPYEDQWGSTYFAELAQTTKEECWVTTQGVPEVFDKHASSFMHEGSVGAQQCGEFYQLTSQYPGTGPCYAIFSYSKIQLNHCIPIFPSEVDVALAQYKASNPNDTRLADPLIQPVSGWDIGLYVLDVINGSELILFAGFVVPTILAVMSLLLMQKSIRLVVFVGVFFCIATITADTVMSFIKGGKVGSMPIGGYIASDVPEGANSTRYAHKLWIFIGTLLACASFALAILAACLWKFYSTVLNLFRVAAQMVSRRPATLVIPFVPLVCYCALALFWIWSSIYLYTSADVVPVERSSLNSIVTWWNPNSTLPIRAYELLNLTAHPSSPEVMSGHPLGTATYEDPTMACAYSPDCYLAISFDILQKHLFTYSYFGFWLANEVITTITGVCIAFYMSHHFFVLPNGTRPHPMSLGRCMVATWLALPPLFIGTFTNACFDWFVIVRPICAIIVKSRSRRIGRDPLEPKIKTLVFAPFRAIGWTAAIAIKYTDRQGYYCSALYNRSYWSGCRIALRMVDEGRVHVRDSMSSATSVFLLCKGAITGLCTLVALALTLTPQYSSPSDYPQTYLTNAVFPVFVCMLSSYFIAELWSQVYEATLSMLLLGYCEDCRVNHGRAKNSPALLVSALENAGSSQDEPQHGEGEMNLPAMKSVYQLDTLSHEEMHMDPRQIGIEPSRRTGRSLNTML